MPIGTASLDSTVSGAAVRLLGRASGFAGVASAARVDHRERLRDRFEGRAFGIHTQEEGDHAGDLSVGEGARCVSEAEGVAVVVEVEMRVIPFGCGNRERARFDRS
jgi:hypothetical protein